MDKQKRDKEIVKLKEEIEQERYNKQMLIEGLQQRLEDGRNYLMEIEADKITVEDALEAFGFGRNGLKT